ncbi:aminoglycoside phosphotransferase [Acidipropionibacterium acidipropionici ATCC 4875]|uniref:Maltokinase n=1 Tax=Acidipropionibacterium acidipropionici (strain ATCC 4875 / DSM 20272 / JCM 6432 / NBRC 12425 / NCIMB 8070 / 4) TaxID=1171373 RepID=K7RNY3_ACIA4|nr:phosphotransferase [Acidipropionibacterium acidipropionici]AFV89714.1 aminoglycoside phosphotransferase [Acidipropionibacterium acidipropionici ATCC 4875]
MRGTTPLPDGSLPGLWEHISTARWFAGKGRGGRLIAAGLFDAVDPDAPCPVHHGLAVVRLGDGSREVYQLLLSERHGPDGPPGICPAPGGGRLCDAAEDEAALAHWARALLDTTAGPTSGADWRVEHMVAFPSRVRAAHRLSGEQSNTTVVAEGDGDQAVMIKVFRRLEPGENLDITTCAALNRAGVDAVPTVFAAVRADVDVPGFRDGPTDLAMATGRFPDAADGWRLICSRAAQGRDVSAEMTELGAALGRVHAAMAGRFGTGLLDGDGTAERMTRELDDAIILAPALAPHRGPLVAIFDELRGRSLPVHRVHGDFHLGQTLSTPDGWRIIDFEGEPLRPAAERRSLDSPWRDVAGMTRSLSYASSEAPGPAEAGRREWLGRARTAFLAGYGHRDDAVLLAYEANKAVYETVYETLNRPGWVGIPLGAITAMCSGAAALLPDTAERKDR